MTQRQLKDKDGQPFAPKSPAEMVSITKLKPTGVNYNSLTVYRCGNVVQVYCEGLTTSSQQSNAVIAKNLPAPLTSQSPYLILNFSTGFALVMGTELKLSAPANQSSGFVQLIYLTT